MKAIIKSLEKKSALLIFDEIENISPSTASSEHWRSDNDFVYFWQTLRSVFQSERGLYTYMLVGTNPVAIEKAQINGLDNPLFSSIPLDYVPGFSVGQIKEMVTRLGGFMGLKFDEGLFSQLRDQFGGHPFLIRQLCSGVHHRAPQSRPFRVDRSVYESARAEFETAGAGYITAIIGVLLESFPDEYDMARYLANGDTRSFNELADQVSTLTRAPRIMASRAGL